MIIIDNLIITGEGKKILSSASINIEPGECFAIFGPGGSGKSLLLKFITGLKEPNLSYDFEQVKIPSSEEIVHFDYNKVKHRHQGLFTELSNKYFLLDEPENGFTIDDFKVHFQKLKSAAKTIVFVTHHLEFLEHFADRIMVLHYGAFKGTYTNHEFFNNEDPYIAYLAKMGC